MIKGNIHSYGDNVNTDVIIPARYLNAFDEVTLAAHCMEDIDTQFAATVKKGDVIVGGQNFGCGSSREHAPLAIKASGVQLIVAKSFARIFYRNCINIGLLAVEDEYFAECLSEAKRVAIDYENKTIIDVDSNKSYRISNFPDFIRDILDAGGLINAVKRGLNV